MYDYEYVTFLFMISISLHFDIFKNENISKKDKDWGFLYHLNVL